IRDLYVTGVQTCALPIYPVKDFAAVSELGTTNLVFAINSSAVPATSLKEFIALVRAKPKQYSFGSFGTGSSGHLYGEIFNESARSEERRVGKECRSRRWR